jgi:hypothetical protein
MRHYTKRRRAGSRPEFTIPQILAWADRHRQRTGRWPQISSGPIRGGLVGESWRKVDTALRLGLRGLPGGSSLSRLLEEQRNVRNPTRPPPLTTAEILAWADAHRARTGAWPTSTSGAVRDAPGETWRAADQALRLGLRGLKGGISLAQLLTASRGVRNHQDLPPLSVTQILEWVDAYQRRSGAWPTSSSGPVTDAPGETWNGIDTALHLGRRGLPGGSSLSRLLAQRRGTRNPKSLPKLSLRDVMRWARAHRQRTGQWPRRSDGPIAEAPGESWSAIHSDLVAGCRGLPAGLTLAKLFDTDEAPAPKRSLPRLSAARILAWADAHHARTGAWPHARAGAIPEAPGDTWRIIDQALRLNQRGLNVGMTLAQFLSERRGLRMRYYAPRLTETQVLAWADAHRRRTGEWPNFRSGPIPEAPGETWRGIDAALQQGCRGLPSDLSLARLLAQKRRARNRANLPPLRVDKILGWARAHRRRTGNWPSSNSGLVAGTPGETWKSIDLALRWAYRGLPGGISLACLLARELGIRNRTCLPPLTPAEIRAWAEAHRRRHGTWPCSTSGKIQEAPAESWSGVDQALRVGYRGLPGGASLGELLTGNGRA